MHSMYFHGRVPNGTEVAGNSSAQFHVKTVAQLLFHVTLRVTTN
jgi:hypothetical protein